MIPATSVEEEELVNFHSDLQRPFLKNHQNVNIVLHRSFKISTEFTDQSSLIKNVARGGRRRRTPERCVISI